MITVSPALNHEGAVEVELIYPKECEHETLTTIAILELASIFEAYTKRFGALEGNEIITEAVGAYLKKRTPS